MFPPPSSKQHFSIAHFPALISCARGGGGTCLLHPSLLRVSSAYQPTLHPPTAFAFTLPPPPLSHCSIDKDEEDSKKKRKA